MRSLLMLVAMVGVGCEDSISPAPREDAAVAVVADASTVRAPRDLAEVPVACKDFEWTREYPDGRRDVTVNRVDVRTDIHPGDSFFVLACYPPGIYDPYTQSQCEPGVVCTGQLYAQGEHCAGWASGGFVDGKLMVSCGQVTTKYGPDGSVLQTIGTYYSSTRLFR